MKPIDTLKSLALTNMMLSGYDSNQKLKPRNKRVKGVNPLDTEYQAKTLEKLNKHFAKGDLSIYKSKQRRKRRGKIKCLK